MKEKEIDYLTASCAKYKSNESYLRSEIGQEELYLFPNRLTSKPIRIGNIVKNSDNDFELSFVVDNTEGIEVPKRVFQFSSKTACMKKAMEILL